MTILAVYYTLADIVLLAQCFYYRGFTLSDTIPESSNSSSPTAANGHESNETSALLSDTSANANTTSTHALSATSRRGSFRESMQHLSNLDAARLSPATPMHPTKRDEQAMKLQAPVQRKRPVFYAVLFNLASVLVVCAAGVLGWWLSRPSSHSHHRHHHSHDHDDGSDQRTDLHFNILGQVFGYICAVLYLGSRLPQLLLNYRRQSTEGLSLLFFIFAVLGNLTYVLSILAYEPKCEHYVDGRLLTGVQYCEPGEARKIYARNFLVNFSWLLGSFGTLLLDAGVFVQYFMYRKNGDVAVEI